MQNVKCKMKNYCRGQAALTAVVFFLFISLAIVLGMSSIALREARIAKINNNAKQSYALAEAGVEDVAYRIARGQNYSSSEVLSLNGFSVTTGVSDITAEEKEITASADVSTSMRNVRAQINKGTKVKLNLAGQVGDGGLDMDNNSMIVGDVYSNGAITGENGSEIIGDATSGGTISSPPAVSGIRTESAPSLALPLSTEAINQWKADATAGGIISSGNFNPPKNSTTSIGPGVIEGHMILKDKQTVILTGTVWVKGHGEIENNATIILDPSYGENSGVLVIDSWLHIKNNGLFSGSGTVGSYLMLLTTAACRGTSGGACTHHNTAIDLHNNAEGAIFYASDGLINLHNNITLNQATGWGIDIDDNSVIEYEPELADVNFLGDVFGGSDRWSVASWQEIE